MTMRSRIHGSGRPAENDRDPGRRTGSVESGPLNGIRDDQAPRIARITPSGSSARRRLNTPSNDTDVKCAD